MTEQKDEAEERKEAVEQDALFRADEAMHADDKAEKEKPFFIHGFVLAVFCLGFGALLALTYHLTVKTIAERGVEDQQASLSQVIPDSIHDNDISANPIHVKDADGRDVEVFRALKEGHVTGVAYEILGSGYSGEIRLMMGVDDQGKILGVRTLAHKETPGLGDKIEATKSDWILRFTGLSSSNPPAEKWKVKKDGGQFDQFSGATITPRGVVAAIHRGLQFFATNKNRLLENPDVK
ncbi:electron transport complex subunit RsxG [Zymomonas mobilis]|uniref:Ion-translocating oxidoreductase complex subunit G n=1 Tax=Zymomonas mobilis subsp. pomaceae (strain ATCC 29192 / DSM 22645 / JCM 10191 / CCUG 17912 / NBRC 13757 / NCIMB 11200 / NRRL B-4491 / Barker I) TaxID=579138 RepID=F8EUN1_ZYMMT|nr:electron transport complex subunit RsxG [Zymomonas mobilis]AEI38177.1 electron transport complex, RnfABCDGE type, G subunit [Zymomonas mobilis subsp. pomaceae ATCC 29192]AEI38214.1 electron transport complex, RnfABCDGE type, G subunit [Zymomonas mobilis subsp. pomaceae ATCC 29192]MDX5947867.1 electron transport complex subunit RsxG [Zymomonas mobilis subsp. pomaceae]MDX5947904.1 electron transport complex subunit RsxG [Zymomonas mobilis subsp. pomaceae]GEB90128.1 electron transport complex 